MSSRSAALSPSTGNPRPALPPKLNKNLDTIETPSVKFQPIDKDGIIVIVGRVKVNTTLSASHPAHAYVLRRYDTGCVSHTTMWRAAFPESDPALEKAEIAYLKANFDLTSARSQDHARLAGVWIPAQLALQLATQYSLSPVIKALTEAAPDPRTVAQSQARNAAARSGTGPNKRRKERHSEDPTAGVSLTPISASRTQAQRRPGSRTTPSRSTGGRRGDSPSVPSSPPPAYNAPTSRRSTRASSAALVKESDSEPEIPVANPEEDISESKALVEALKLEQKQAKVVSPGRPKSKRNREEAEAPLTINLDKPVDEKTPTDRTVVSNRRVFPTWPTLANLQPSQKAAAWGTLAFAIGLGATAYLPQFF